MKIMARLAKIEDDGYCTVFAFANDAENPDCYAILQITNKPSMQDIGLGQGGVHFELGGHNLSGYNLVKSIEQTPDGVALTIEERAAQRAGFDGHVEIKFEERSLIGDMTAEAAVKIFQERLTDEQ